MVPRLRHRHHERLAAAHQGQHQFALGHVAGHGGHRFRHGRHRERVDDFDAEPPREPGAQLRLAQHMRGHEDLAELPVRRGVTLGDERPLD
ncbi:hypothetical protein NQ652_18045, partial [Acinetobacter baumannii]|nr:hypothetical protein [Acinetobacter baumannii]